jgi:hypothetical protein
VRDLDPEYAAVALDPAIVRRAAQHFGKPDVVLSAVVAYLKTWAWRAPPATTAARCTA